MMVKQKRRSSRGSSLLRVALLAAWAGPELAAPQSIVVEIKEPDGVQEPEQCVKCHQKVNPNLVAAFQASTMGRSGIQNQAVYDEVKKQRAPKEKTERRKAFLVRNGQISCVLCHGDNHTTITQTRGRVANAVCGGCHDTIDQEYEKGGGHSVDPPEESWKRALAAPEFSPVPPAVRQLSRDVIYSQQGATAPPYFDPDPEFEGTGRIHRNGCISCHTRHSFDVAEARKPEGCQTCHARGGNSVFDSYLESKHGSIYMAAGSRWNWDLRMPVALAKKEYEAPSCATCHMLQAERYGDLKTTHRMTAKTIWSRGLQPLVVEGDKATEAGYKAFFQQLRQQSEAKRKEMILVCRNCHSEKFAGDYLNAADEVKLASDLLVLRARSILDGLSRDGLLESSSAALIRRYQTVPAGTEAGASTPATPGTLAPLAAIERAFLEMARRDNVRTALSAFHGSPGGVYWEGYARVEKALEHIRGVEKEMRQTLSKTAGVSGATGTPRGSPK
ncbi:MAG: hypothetical protein HYR60_15645 [Acidobacteria bacterium]|nr:hypothetical protein [Acidobacteriota bacterium]